jgi:hypothetical protein
MMSGKFPETGDDVTQIPDSVSQASGDVGVPDALDGAPGEATAHPVVDPVPLSVTSAATEGIPSPEGWAGPPDATLPTPRPRRRSARTKVLVTTTVGLVLAAAAAVVVVVVNLPQVPPVLRPTGLIVASTTYTTVQFDWSGPRTGPLPTRYLIFQNGSPIGMVSGRMITYQATALSPNTPYQYQVMAIRQHRRSPLSAPLDVSTLATPPVSEAVLIGPFTVSYKIESWYGFTAKPKPGLDYWTFTPPACVFEPCSAPLHGAFASHLFTTTLHRHGGVYTGTAVVGKYTSCGGTAIPSDITYRLTARGAAANGPLWLVTSWTGTMTLSSPAGLGCVPSGTMARISGTSG